MWPWNSVEYSEASTQTESFHDTLSVDHFTFQMTVKEYLDFINHCNNKEIKAIELFFYLLKHKDVLDLPKFQKLKGNILTKLDTVEFRDHRRYANLFRLFKTELEF